MTTQIRSSFFLALARARARIPPLRPTYFMLHIGKTGGSYTRHVFSAIPKARSLVRVLTHSHSLEAALKEFPAQKAIFTIRDPFQIFVSGFYSRRRKGQPRYNKPWSADETVAFSAFGTPNELAEALSSADQQRRDRAEFSMRCILHVARCLHFYLGSVPLLREHQSRIAFILRQEHLDADIHAFLAANGVETPAAQITDEVIRHANPTTLDKTLSQTAIRNLSAWYRTDLELYRECQAIASVLNPLSH